MKNSFVELGDVCEIVIGKTPSRDNPLYWGEGHPWVAISDIGKGMFIDKTKEEITDKALKAGGCKLIPKNTVIMSFKLSIGKLAITAKELFTNEAIAALIIKDTDLIDPIYLYFALKNADLKKETDKAVKGLTLNKPKLQRIKIYLPDRKEQKRITSLLMSINFLIQKRKDTIAKLGEFDKSVFFNMFGDPILNTKSWPLMKIGDLVSKIETGKSLKPAEEDFVDCNRVLKISAITRGNFKPNESKPLPLDYSPPGSHYVQKDDFLFGRANTTELVGAVAIVDGDYPDLVLPDKIWRIVWKSEVILNRYVYSVFWDPGFKSKLGSVSTGTGGSMKNISQGKLLELSVPVPPLELQEKYSRIITSKMKASTNYSASLLELEKLHSSLMDKNFKREGK